MHKLELNYDYIREFSTSVSQRKSDNTITKGPSTITIPANIVSEFDIESNDIVRVILVSVTKKKSTKG